MKILLVIPPFTQINTPYPSVTQLCGYLSHTNFEAKSVDLSIKVFLRIFCESGLTKIFDDASRNLADENSTRTFSLKNEYINKIDSVISFLQGKNTNSAYLLAQEGYLPQGESFVHDMDELKTFGEMGIQDKAKYYCSLFIDDITKFIQKNVDHKFGLSRYAEKIAVSLPNFDPILNELNSSSTLVDNLIKDETAKAMLKFNADFIALSVPFPGNLLGALVVAQYIKKNYAGKKIILGGGYINTELRKIKDYRIFDLIDYITYDDGELPIKNILMNEKPDSDSVEYIRTLSPHKNIFPDLDNSKTIHHNDLPAPSLNGIDPSEYISMSEMLNPMHRLWSDGYWNKLTIAHGCYWHKCSFCDTSLDYIKRYSPAKAKTVVDWMEQMISESGRTSFHFTDEAAPPSLLREIAIEILKRKLKVSWWGNIRYEKNFSAELCRLMALSGCIAVSGGIEVADDRILQLINKGVSISQAADVCMNFIEAGIMTHAYLMFGFPTQTEQEIVNSLEIVRQFIESGLITSAFWHQFSLTYHSPVYLEKEKFKIEVLNYPNNDFANNDLLHKDITKLDYSKYSFGLNKALYNFMHGSCFDWHSNQWFHFEMPRTTIKRNFLKKILSNRNSVNNKTFSKIFWYGGNPVVFSQKNNAKVIIHSNNASGEWDTSFKTANWIKKYFSQQGEIDLENFINNYPDNFEKFTLSEMWEELKVLGMIVL